MSPPDDGRQPGETPIDDLSGLLVKGIATRAQLNKIEADNIRKALTKYFAEPPTPELTPFDFGWILHLHREMFGEVWEWAGRFRTRNLNLGAPWTRISERLFNMLEDLEFWKSNDLELVEQATRLHHAAVEIHPFVNGNGRWARMLTNLWLARHGGPIVEWPESTIGGESTARGEYIKALRAADQGDLEPLLTLHRRYLGKPG